MKPLRLDSTLLLLLGVFSASAAEADASDPASAVQVSVSREPDLVTVQARHAQMSQVIDALSKKTSAKVHYPALPDEPVTATCAGENLKMVMECLLGGSANLFYQAPDGKDRGSRGTSGGELWILGSSRAPAENGQQRASEARQWGTSDGNHGRAGAQMNAMDPAELKRLLDMARSEAASLRAEALSRLTAEGQTGNESIRHVFAAAMADRDPRVRAQAVYGLSREGGAEAIGVLQEAMQDADADVRSMAVDSVATSDASGLALLRQALADADGTVRQLAALKLQLAEIPDSR